MRPVLKKLKDEINSKMKPRYERDEEYYKLLEGAAYKESSPPPPHHANAYTTNTRLVL